VRVSIALLFLIACGAPPPAVTPTQAVVADGEQQIRDLGTCDLESGEKVQDCKIGFRTFGKLDAARANVVLFPTWFTGTTKPLVDLVPQKLVDTSRFHLILVDALADGVSTAPSNSTKQARLRFPKITIRDMVVSQRKLLDSLGIKRLHAVMGISMGGMQALEWGVTRPDDVARVVSIVGTPQLTSQDMLLWNAELHALENDVAYKNGEYEGRPQMRAVQDIHWLNLTTPAHRANETSREAFPKWLAEKEADVAFDWNDWRRQLEAMLVHDVAHGGALEDAAKRVKAKMLVVVADQDHMVNPGPAKRFAQAANAKLVTFDTPCGHFAPGCESAKLGEAVKAFLAENP
jgi:homoserine O-acetyltransferase